MLERSLGRWISVIYRYGQIYITRELKPYAIGKGQFLFLMALYHRDGMRQEELAHLLNMDKGTTARAIGKLEKAGFVRREASREDHRANRVFLTPLALEFQTKLAAILQRWSEIISAGLSEEELDQAYGLLSRMAQNAVAYVQKNRGFKAKS
ncbi:MAG TPA: MarR family transcriptional regulator [Bacillota bacterium]|nr:MarR family transcriptional regulator [Bacillota bacterium]